jgi:ADP-ribose pyrophosphatase
MRNALPQLPDVSLESQSESVDSTPGFLSLHRTRYCAVNADGRRSPEFVYDSVERKALDAVVIAAHYREAGRTFVYLRSAIRPPVALRTRQATPDRQLASIHLWELPAGLVELYEANPDGPARCAARETREELGFELDPSRFEEIGHGTYPVPGMIAERQFFFAVEVEPTKRGSPTLDGSPLEESGVVFSVELGEALQMCRRGEILDGKTELGLRRLEEALAS